MNQAAQAQQHAQTADLAREDQVLVVIPARLKSTRFPEKMLARKTGRPLVQHVVDRVMACDTVDKVIVAADDTKISEALERYGTSVILTDPSHASGTDRVAEVARSFSYDLVVNVQGDEPEIDPESIRRLIELMRTPAGGFVPEMGTLCTPYPDDADPSDPNLVKVVLAPGGRAIYFSRSPIPYERDRNGPGNLLLHLGIYAYRREVLLRLADYVPTPLEQSEKLEQLRVLEHGHTIHAVVVSHRSHGIDTPEQYEAFVRRFDATG